MGKFHVIPLFITGPVLAFGVLSGFAATQASGQVIRNFGWVLRPAPPTSPQQQSQFSRDQDEQRRLATERARDEQQSKDDDECLAQFQPNENPPPLQRAAASGSVHDLLKELAGGVRVNDADPLNGWTALHYASHFGSAEAVEALIANRAPVNLGTGKGKCTPLILAAAAGNNAIVQTLILNGADVNAAGWAGTPLQAAARKLNADGVMLLLANGAKPNIASRGLSVLAFAEQGKEEAMQEGDRIGDSALGRYAQIVDALGAFGAATGHAAADATALKQRILLDYQGLNWTPPTAPRTEPIPSNQQHVGRIRSNSALTAEPATRPVSGSNGSAALPASQPGRE